jgi:hypothetical protein
MERNRNWLAIAALALASLALVVALAGLFGPRGLRGGPPAFAQAPFERGQSAEELGREWRRGEGFGAGQPGHHSFRPGAWHDGRPGFGHSVGPLGMLFGLINTLVKLAALGLLAWLLLRLFQQRNTPPAAPAATAPTTPAGHDPRVE